MSKTILLLAAAGFAFLSSAAVAGVFKNQSLQASSDGVNVTVTWTTLDESGVDHFEIQRATTGGMFQLIETIRPTGSSTYQYVDRSALMKVMTIYQYRIQAFMKGQSQAAETLGPVTVSHNVSGVRRTWGSIKAMFR